MDDIQQEKIISLIKDGDLSRLIPTLEGVLQKQEEQLTSTTDPTILLQTAIQAMQLDVLDYLLTLFFAQEGGKPKEGHLRLLGRVVILEALDRDRVPVFELLCRHDPALQTMYVGHTGPPLAWAAKFENLALVSFLLARGVEPNKTQIDHRPAVSIVAGWGSCAVMELLLDHGAVVSGTDALFNAAFQRRIDMLALLLETRKAADINSIQPDRSSTWLSGRGTRKWFAC
ncbi:hypothetical protein ASPZODRAFT_157198 [Penicilliopsis zonata CBS 506.65]|uniref:Uncharacterized protein n=1 Tax=Penicilliopsis zonata CBS 506.65 TaxID=1073090 RepID=A0A1L9ST55_9EURO|nr:hypothetical protein ASPZODRAFT_157198 [Penicilliopsis zonata CBS 506.65]OJJ50284.1 hypothetical protein ASPZODRAFT_157198 [Penicilliopsis zonata CBS 506.65]